MALRAPPAGALYEEAIRRREASLCHLGPLVLRTGRYTGRSAKEKFIVREPSSEDMVWWGEHNKPFDPEPFMATTRWGLAVLRYEVVPVQP